MTTQEIIDRIAGWLQDEVCSRLEFKVAAEYKRAADAGYRHRLSHPAVYPAFFPNDAAEHDAPDDSSPVVAPCIIVSLSGQSTMNRSDGWVETPVTLSLQIWNPGVHILDDGVPGFQIGDEGWRDIAVFTDTVVKALANAELPGGLSISGTTIDYSLPDVQKNEYYPYYRSEVNFSVSHLRRLASKFNI